MPASEFDVFISYSSRDRKWVKTWLLPRLEKAGLRVCIDYRDFKFGVPSLKNIDSANGRFVDVVGDSRRFPCSGPSLCEIDESE